jgi:hypothetical protein
VLLLARRPEQAGTEPHPTHGAGHLTRATKEDRGRGASAAANPGEPAPEFADLDMVWVVLSWSKQKTVAVFEDIHHRAHPSSGRRLQRRTRSVKETEGTVEAASEAVR